MKTTPQTQTTKDHPFSTIYLLLILALCALICFSCDSEKSSYSGDLIEAQANPEVHVAFAGGGWRAHTGHSGWVMSLLNNDKKLDQAFKNVKSISSNSGGSWFSTMLMYSDSFVADIEKPGAIQMWDSTGWLGGQKHILQDGYCEKKSWWNYFGCIFNNMGLASNKAGYWDQVVENIVYKDYPMNDSIKLGSSSRVKWAKDKPLLLAATLLTSSVVVNDTSFWYGTAADHRYYQICIDSMIPQLNQNYGGSCNGSTTPYVRPVTFSSIPSSSPLPNQPSFFSHKRADGAKTVYNIGYTEDWFSGTPPIRRNSIQNPISADDVPVRIAASASSAAMGFVSMEPVAYSLPAIGNLPWNVAFEFEDEALSFSMEGGKATFMDAKGKTIDEVNKKQIVRIADGGPMDNTGVAQLVSFLQENGEKNGFNIVAFDNVEKPFSTSSGADVGVDIANLFGEGLKNNKSDFCAELGAGVDLCIAVPQVQIFDPVALDTTNFIFQTKHNNSNSHKLVYTKYTVKTVPNENFGIQSGGTGTLHAFSCIWDGASTAPYENKNFIAYSEMLAFINKGLTQDQNGKGLQCLKDAFMIK